MSDSTEVALPTAAEMEEWGGSTGLEDIDAGDVVIPRLRIVHDEAVWENNLTHERYTELDCIVLGLVKQRIMFFDKVEDKDGPQCKSPNFDQGFPNFEKGRNETHFPWAQSNFNESQAVPLEIEPDPSGPWPRGWSSNGHAILPCPNCIFKEWNKTAPDGTTWKAPPCNEQHTYPLLYVVNKGTEDEDWLPALWTTQKTGIKPSRAYLSHFKSKNMPPFTVFTKITLDQQKRGTNKYCVPQFKIGGTTERTMWSNYSTQMRTIRDFVRLAPRPADDYEVDESAEPSANVNTAPVAETAKPVTTSASVTAADDDDLPF